MQVESQPLKSNWNESRTTRPAAWVVAESYADVTGVIADPERYPSPVLPVGSFLSVTDCVTNDGGTILTTRRLDRVLGLETDARGRRVVRVQAGCRLKALAQWLQARNVEIPFMAEIGDATVGSVAVGDTKESSIDGAGYFSAHVTSVTYAGPDGAVATLADRTDGARFREFLCSFGLGGIVLEATLEVRPARLCRSSVSIAAWDSPAALAEGLLELRARSDNLFAIVMVEKLAALADQRWNAGPGNASPAASQPVLETFRAKKREAIQRGLAGVELPMPRDLVYSRPDLVNGYDAPRPGEPRLDFNYYEHDAGAIRRVVEATHRYTVDFQARTGFAPAGWAVYFVRRPGNKPFGLYSGAAGESLSFDPVTSDPADVRWHDFTRGYNRLAIDTLGARVSPIQTQHCVAGDLTIPARLAHPRFTTAYYRQFLAG